MIKKRVIYIHGFNSSPKSVKATLFGDYLKNKFGEQVEYLVPCLDHEPLKALLTVESLIHRNTVLIGSSLGGFFATYLSQKHHVRAVVVNPAVAPFELMQDYLGRQYNPYQDYYYQLELSHVAQLKMLYLTQLAQPNLIFLLQQTADEVLDFQQAVKYYQNCKQQIEFAGDHSFVEFERHFLSIAQFLNIKNN